MEAEWVMVIVTCIYVFFTIGIFVANGISANATRKQLQQAIKQLKESERQFDESQKLDCMPFLQLEPAEISNYKEFKIEIFTDCNLLDTETNELFNGYQLCFWLKNIGKGPAINLVYSWEYNNGKYKVDMLPINGIKDGDKYLVEFYVEYNEKIDGILEWGFSDVLGNEYTQKETLVFEKDSLIKFENDTPK